MSSNSCPGPEVIDALLNSSLSNSQQLQVERHIDGCTACQQRLAADALASSPVPAEPLPPNLRLGADASPSLRKVVDRLQGEPPPSHGAFFPAGVVRPISDHGVSRPPVNLLGKYRLLEQRGHGGMGVLYKGIDLTLERTVAIKQLHAGADHDPVARLRLMREARAAAAVRHENIVSVFAVEEMDGEPLVVMEYVEGESLAERLARCGPLSVPAVIRLGIEVAAGLAAAHAQGLVHRDIKPANLLFQATTGQVKIADFGLARTAGDLRLTRPDAVAGTPEFMSPEQAQGQTADHRSDLFSLGCVLFVALTGVSPFQAAEPLVAVRRVIEHTPPDVRQLRAEVPEGLAQLIGRLLHKDPSGRLPSAAAVGQQLLRIPPGARSQGTPARRFATLKACRRRWKQTAGGLVLLILATTIAWRAWTVRPIEATPRRGFAVLPASDLEAPIVYSTLAEAIAAAEDGGIIEVYGGQRYGLAPVRIRDKALTVRAAGSSRPILTIPDSMPPSYAPILTSNAPLHLVGLQIEWAMRATRRDDSRESSRDAQVRPCAVLSVDSSLVVTDCQFRVGRNMACLALVRSSGHLNGCRLVARHGAGIGWQPVPRNRLLITGTRLVGRGGVMLSNAALSSGNGRPQLNVTRSVFQTEYAFQLTGDSGTDRTMTWRAEECQFDVMWMYLVAGDPRASGIHASPGRWLRRQVQWQEGGNRYGASCKFLGLIGPAGRIQLAPESPRQLADWNAFWSE